MKLKKKLLLFILTSALIVPQTAFASLIPDEQIVNDDSSQITIKNVDFTSLAGTGTLKITYQHSAYDENRANNKSDDDLYAYKFASKITDEQTGTDSINYDSKDPQIEEPGSKILNVYPNSCKTILADVIMKDKKYYCDPDTGDQILTMDKISWNGFFANVERNLVNADGSYKYDGIYFGSCDGNGFQEIPDSATDILTKYIEAGNSVVCGHDEQNTDFFKTYFGAISDESVLIPSDISTGWGGKKYEIKVAITDNNGEGTFPSSDLGAGNNLTTFPFKFDMGTLIDANFTHCGYENVGNTNAVMYTLLPTDKAYVWASIGDKTSASSVMTTEIDGQQYYYNPYLFTSKAYPNVACSMIGHSSKGTEAEYKLVVNMLLNISPYYNAPGQTYTKTYKDTASPDAPTLTLTGSGDNTYEISSTDKGISVDVAIKQYGKYGIDNADGSASISNLNVLAGMEKFLYSTDNDEIGGVTYLLDDNDIPTATGNTKEIDAFDLSGFGKSEITIGETPDKYIHVVAVDSNGNISKVTTIKNQKYVTITFKNQDENVIDSKLLPWGTPIYVLDKDGHKLRTFEAKQSRTLFMEDLPEKKDYTAKGYTVYEDEGSVILKQVYSHNSIISQAKEKTADVTEKTADKTGLSENKIVVIFILICALGIFLFYLLLKKLFKSDDHEDLDDEK